MNEQSARASRVAPLISSLAAAWVLAASPLHANDARAAARGVWTGSYECGAIAKLPKKWAAYTARVELVLENGYATVGRETARVVESMSGPVEPDGRVVLEGAGKWKDPALGTGWRFRYSGRFSGDRFEAVGTMYSPDGQRVMRECTMSLARALDADGALPAARGTPPWVANYTRTAAPLPAATATVVGTALAAAQAAEVDGGPPAAGVPPAAAVEDPAVAVPREVDLAGAHNTAVLEDVVSPGAPHRFGVWARGGDLLSVALHAAQEGVRFVVYEPGAAARLTDGGLLVEGVALRGHAEAGRFTAALPMAGRYLVVVDAERAASPYTLDVTVSAGATTAEPRNPLLLALLLGTAAAATGVAVYRRRQERFRAGADPDRPARTEPAGAPIMEPPLAPGLELPPVDVPPPNPDAHERHASGTPPCEVRAASPLPAAREPAAGLEAAPPPESPRARPRRRRGGARRRTGPTGE